MDPVTTSAAHRHHHRNFHVPFHPILHAPAPHLRPHPILNSQKVPAAADDNELISRPAKPPIFSTCNTINSFQSHLLEISDGCDVANSVAAFATRRQRGFCILRGSGAVVDVTIRQPGYSDTVVTLHGRFEILSISGLFWSAAAAGVTVFLAGEQGEVVGGSVVGELTASGKVILMAVSFVDAVVERLPVPPEEEKVAANG